MDTAIGLRFGADWQAANVFWRSRQRTFQNGSEIERHQALIVALGEDRLPCANTDASVALPGCQRALPGRMRRRACERSLCNKQDIWLSRRSRTPRTG